MVKIEELTPKNLAGAVSLVCTEFPPVDEPERADWELSASLGPLAYQDYLKKTQISSLKYWVATEKSKVIGVTGLYNYKSDKEDTIWLGWFVVGPSFRDKGLGELLLKFTIRQAKLQGKKFLKVYTVPEPGRDTRMFFEGNGFKLIKQELWNGPGEYTAYYYQFNLGSTI